MKMNSIIRPSILYYLSDFILEKTYKLSMIKETLLIFQFLSILPAAKSALSLDFLLEETMCGIGVFSSNTSCHHSVISNDIHLVDEAPEAFAEDSIFFVESSCSGGLDFRQACAVEAAAKVHPKKQINVLFPGPVPGHCLFKSPLFDIFKYKNINLYRIYMKRYLSETPIAKLWSSSVWNISYYPVHHTADILRYVTLYKHGGIYLDLDVIVIKPLEELPRDINWVGKEDARNIGVGLLSLSKHGIGHIIAREVLSNIRDNFKPQSWSYHSVGVLTEVLKKICNTTDVQQMNISKCKGFEIYDSTYFYAVPFQVWKNFFQDIDGDLNEGMTFAYHMWNNLSQDEVIYHDSIFAHIMRRHCPKIFDIMSARRR